MKKVQNCYEMEILHGVLDMRGVLRWVGCNTDAWLGAFFNAFICSFLYLFVANLLPYEEKFRNCANYRKIPQNLSDNTHKHTHTRI